MTNAADDDEEEVEAANEDASEGGVVTQDLAEGTTEGGGDSNRALVNVKVVVVSCHRYTLNRKTAIRT